MRHEERGRQRILKERKGEQRQGERYHSAEDRERKISTKSEKEGEKEGGPGETDGEDREEDREEDGQRGRVRR